jgi:hypothetical protein
MSDWAHFVHKFKNSLAFLPISHKEKVREVLYKSGKRINIHYETTMDEPYLFTISIDYKKTPFYLSYLLQSMENSCYKSLMKEIELQMNKKMWLNKEGLPLNAKSMASKLRQVIISIATMSALNKHVTELMRPMDLTGQVMSQRGSQGSALPNPHGMASTPQNTLTLRSRIIILATSKWQPAGTLHAQSRKMKTLEARKMSTASGVTEVPYDLELCGQTNYLETKNNV